MALRKMACYLWGDRMHDAAQSYKEAIILPEVLY